MTDAPLLMIAEGRKPRPRSTPAVRDKEIVLHIRVAGLLRAHGLPGWRWTHIPAGELRDARTASKLKAMGLNPGWPDFLLVSPTGKAHFLEVKRVGGKLSEDQRAFKAWAAAHGVAHVVADTFATAFDALKLWKVLGGAHG